LAVPVTVKEIVMPRARGNDTDGGGEQPSRRKKRPEGVQRTADFAGWINVNIPKADKPAVDDFGASTQFPDALDALLKTHHRITLVWNLKDECFQANSFCMDEGSPNAGLMVSARSDDPSRAVVKLAYIHDALLPDDYSDAGEERSDW
jgi:hypothetical protein